jgi:hypothetical protein
LGVVLDPLAHDEPWLYGNASIAGAQFGDAGLERLRPLAGNLRVLDLGGTAVTDAGLTAVATVKHLSPAAGSAETA